ncbi:22223_t:CDS:2, partial [Dentiscutata erythropus]
KSEDKKPLHNSSMPDGSEHEINYIDSEGVKRPKGIRRVLQERGLWKQGLLKKCNDCKKNRPDPNNLNCCASRILLAQTDFATQTSRIQENEQDAGSVAAYIW